MDNTFKGVIAYPVTPFHANGAIDVDMLRTLVDRLVESGVHGIAPLGSTGESAYLADDEWETVARVSVEAVAKRVPTIVGIAELTTQGAIKRARFAERIGANAVMVLPVSYWKLSDAEIVAHYAAIDDAIALPIMLYNNPATSGIDMQPELIARICREVPKVTMVKDSTGDVQRLHRLKQLTGGAVRLFNGSNPLAFAALNAGAVGWCTAAPNLDLAGPLALYEQIQRNDIAAARATFERILPLLQFLVRIGLPTSVKAGLALQGIQAGVPRLPLQPLTPAATRELSDILEKVGHATA